VPFQIPPQEAARDRGVLQRLFVSHTIGRRMTVQRQQLRGRNPQRRTINARRTINGAQAVHNRRTVARGRPVRHGRSRASQVRRTEGQALAAPAHEKRLTEGLARAVDAPARFFGCRCGSKFAWGRRIGLLAPVHNGG